MAMLRHRERRNGHAPALPRCGRGFDEYDDRLESGAGQVVVWDGHDGSQTLSTLTIHPKAKLVMGALGPSMLMERHFSAVAYVGQHSKANIRG